MPTWCRRTWAVVVALALVVPVSFEARAGCRTCPPDCPMHVERDASALGCHRGQAGPERRLPLASEAHRSELELRNSCGHDLGEAATVHMRLRPDAPTVHDPLETDRSRPRSDRRPPALVSDVPTLPPRPVVSA